MDLELYQENVMDHYKNPRGKKVMENATFSYTENNPLCGDEVTFYVRLDGDIIEEITFTGHGCAISLASASLLIEYLKGKEVDAIKEVTDDKIKALLGVPISHTRIKCALLSQKTVQKGLEEYNDTHN
ncbi:TPA: SUF system NifU family Fe-S cluster assembly protein [Candidatus Woesearchaeota archaeon]|jgi:nitrogen fixation NifU-like protein|nr:SUF system NifU family Fe-S cluster assembly protein [archaeon]HIJ11092.1 SUF system NifU family Fe-S cluster assembly protein [Candidatus Woesearchaeota archaeon]